MLENITFFMEPLNAKSSVFGTPIWNASSAELIISLDHGINCKLFSLVIQCETSDKIIVSSSYITVWKLEHCVIDSNF